MLFRLMRRLENNSKEAKEKEKKRGFTLRLVRRVKISFFSLPLLFQCVLVRQERERKIIEVETPHVFLLVLSFFSLSSSLVLLGGERGDCYTIVTWLILPVVICLSQRLSHACLSINTLYCETADGSLNQL